MLKSLVGDKKFYKMAMTVAVPIMIQNLITNFVSMLDNIMVGQVGTAPMSGVAIVNQVLFVLYLCLFGAVSGAGIFTAQFAGSRDDEGVRYTFRFKLISCLLISFVGLVVFITFGEELVRLYLKGEGSAGDAELFLKYGMEYLEIMLWGLIPFAISNVYCSTLRENGETLIPMLAGIVAVFVNLIFNYILIFGHFGFPAMGVRGAAMATVISRFVELGIAAVWTHTHTKRMGFAKGLYSSLKIPAELAKNIIKKGFPLVVNEGLWAGGMAMLNQCYSIRGLDVVAAVNISTTICNVMGVSFMAMGNSVGIIIGQKLGAGCSEEEVRDTDRKLIAFSVACALVFGAVTVLLSSVFPALYNTTESVKDLAAGFIRVTAVFMPFHAYTHAAYFTLRSGGKTLITFIFDSCFVCGVCVPVAFCLSRFTGLPITPLYFICQGMEVIKSFIGAYMIKQGKWIQNIIKA